MTAALKRVVGAVLRGGWRAVLDVEHDVWRKLRAVLVGRTSQDGQDDSAPRVSA